MKKYLILFLLTVSLLHHITQANTLDLLALQTGTDKSSSAHYYTKIYEKYFTPLKNNPLNILEIGLCLGASARLWDQYFINPDTHLYFIDIQDSLFNQIKNTVSSRCNFYKANQENKTELTNFVHTFNVMFDIIIDDGGHTMKQQINSFEAL
jgi:hypothetical protein